MAIKMQYLPRKRKLKVKKSRRKIRRTFRFYLDQMIRIGQTFVSKLSSIVQVIAITIVNEFREFESPDLDLMKE